MDKMRRKSIGIKNPIDYSNEGKKYRGVRIITLLIDKSGFDNRKFVMIEFVDLKGNRLYKIPGGRREKGENILVTAYRELEEEIGVIPNKLLAIGDLQFYNDKGEEYYEKLFLGIIQVNEVNEIYGKINSEKSIVIMTREALYKILKNGELELKSTVAIKLWARLLAENGRFIEKISNIIM